MHKLILTSLFLFLSWICLMNAEFQAGSRFASTVGEGAVNTIANSQEVLVTDLQGDKKISITEEQLQSFRSYVTIDSSYVFDMKKRCLFVPEISFEFKGTPDVSIYVSMMCNQVKVVSENKSIILDYDLVKDGFNKLNEEIIAE